MKNNKRIVTLSIIFMLLFINCNITFINSKKINISNNDENHPPLIPNKPICFDDYPDKIHNSNFVKCDESYIFFFGNLVDEDNDQMAFWIDWGDGSELQRFPMFDGSYIILNSCHIILEHKFSSVSSINPFLIRVKSEDEHGLQSSWSESLPLWVTFIKSYSRFSIQLLERMFVQKALAVIFFYWFEENRAINFIYNIILWM